MPSQHWIRLYDTILSDPKMGTMPDHLWRRAIELFLIAGKTTKDGLLPSVNDMAWLLHSSEGEILDVLHALNDCEIVHETEQGWIVTNFVKWQTSESLERVRRYREKQNTRDNNVTITDTVTEPPLSLSLNSLINRGGVKGGETAAAIVEYNDIAAQDAERLYVDVTGQMSIPSTQVDKALQDLATIAAHYKDRDYALVDGKRIFARWCSTKGKSGKTYSRINTGWLTWWLDEIAPSPANAPPIEIPKPNVICGDGDRLRHFAENHKGDRSFTQALQDYQTHLRSCRICSGGSNSNEIQTVIDKLAGKMSAPPAQGSPAQAPKPPPTQ